MSILLYINIILVIAIVYLFYIHETEHFTDGLHTKNKIFEKIDNIIQTTSSSLKIKKLKDIIIGYWNQANFSSDTRSKCFDCDKSMPEKAHGYSCFDCEEEDKKVFRHTLDEDN